MEGRFAHRRGQNNLVPSLVGVIGQRVMPMIMSWGEQKFVTRGVKKAEAEVNVVMLVTFEFNLGPINIK